MPLSEQDAVRTAAQRAAEVVGPLVAESEPVLAAYGRGGGQADRGAFGGLLRVFRDYADAIGRAQDALIHTWREALWPLDQGAELDVHALVPETADTASEVLAAVEALNRTVEAGRPLASDALAVLDQRCQSAQAAAAKLGVVPVPATVLTFFTEVAEQTTVPLTAISPDVFAWLDEHDAMRLFVVGRSD